jgi:hypothetical protein
MAGVVKVIWSAVEGFLAQSGIRVNLAVATRAGQVVIVEGPRNDRDLGAALTAACGAVAAYPDLVAIVSNGQILIGNSRAVADLITASQSVRDPLRRLFYSYPY